MIAMPWIATGIFVYQSFILSSKNWGPYVIAQSFMAYSVLSVITLAVDSADLLFTVPVIAVSVESNPSATLPNSP